MNKLQNSNPDLNISNPEQNNNNNNNSINMPNTCNNIVDNKNNFINFNENINNDIKMPIFPSFLNESKKTLNENNIIYNSQNKLNNKIINSINIDSNNQIQNIFNNRNSFMINNPNNNFLSVYQDSMKRALFPGSSQFTFVPSFHNNIYVNPINNNLDNLININQINFSNYLKKTNINDNENNNIFIGKKKLN